MEARSKSRDICVIVTVCCVTILSIFLTGATSVAIPTIGRDLHFKESELQWPLNVYTLSYGCLLLLCGRIADILGCKKMFLLGSGWFGIWSIAAAFAKTPVSFILFLGLQGIGSAANIPAGVSIISSYFPPGKWKNAAFAILGSGQPIGFIIGMIIGGLLAQSEATWRTIYWMQAGLAGALTVVGFFVLPADTHENRYNQGLDLVGAALSTAGIGLLVYDLAESTVTPRGWATPFVPSLLGTAVILIVSFVVWEIRREAKGQSVLFPMSLWKQPKAMMGPIVLIVFFGWWAFNTLGYFVPLYFQQVLLLSPLQTSVRLIPMGLTGLITNLVTGYLIGVVPAQILVVLGLLSAMGSCIVFAVIDMHSIYWSMAFFVCGLLPIIDLVYTVANMQVCAAFPVHSQALAGSIFAVATRLGGSIGLSVTSSVANSVSAKYNRHHLGLASTDPAVLLAGFRSAGWTCFGAAAVALVISCIGMRGAGIVGQEQVQSTEEDKGSIEKHEDIEMDSVGRSSSNGVTDVHESSTQPSASGSA